MEISEFDEVVENALKRSKHVLIHKAKEYAKEGDRLHNFNRGSEIAGCSREKVLKGFLLKHLVSVFDIIDDIDKGIIPERAFIDEKIGDSINYFILLEASIVDKINIKNKDNENQSNRSNS